MERYLSGAQSMAAELGIELVEFRAHNAPEQQAAMLESAAQQDFDALVVNHGSSEVLGPVVKKALQQGAKIVTFDLVVDDPGVPEIEQDDMLVAFTLARKLVDDFSGQANVVYINADGYAPLEKRDRIWQNFKWRYAHLNEVAHIGQVSAETDVDTQAQLAGLLREHAETEVVIAMWDEFAKGAVRAIQEAGQAERVKVYGVDITDEDIQMMAAGNSPWAVTVATDSYNIGRLAVRAGAALAAGEKLNKYLEVEPVLIAQEFLRAHEVKNMDDLIRQLPSLGESNLLWFDWMEPVLARNGSAMPKLLLSTEQLLAQLQAALASQQHRNAQLQASGEIVQAIIGLLDLRELLQKTVDLTLQRFDLDFAGLYLKTGAIEPWVYLQAGTGEAGQTLLRQNYGMRLDRSSLVGECILTGEVRSLQARDASQERSINPALPGMRSELLLPLTSRGDPIGALSLQSRRAAVFSEEEITLFRSLATLVAISIENLRLLKQTQDAVEELKGLQKRSVQERWKK